MGLCVNTHHRMRRVSSCERGGIVLTITCPEPVDRYRINLQTCGWWDETPNPSPRSGVESRDTRWCLRILTYEVGAARTENAEHVRIMRWQCLPVPIPTLESSANSTEKSELCRLAQLLDLWWRSGQGGWDWGASFL